MSSVVRISARIIDWPKFCASCCGRADYKIPISYTRVEGVKVIRQTTKSFDVPYCYKCAEWGQVQDEIDYLENELVLVNDDIRTAENYIEYGYPSLPNEYFVYVVIFAFLTCGLGAASYFYFRDQHLRKCRAVLNELPSNRRFANELHDKIDALTKKSRKLMPAQGGVHFPPIRYYGWEGSVHTFEFYSTEYARQFRALNGKKILRD